MDSRQIPGYQNDEMILYRKGNYRQFQFPQFGCDIRGIHSDNKYLYFVSNNDVRWFEADGREGYREPFFGTELNGPSDLVTLNDWDYYVADRMVGLLKMVKYQGMRDTIRPNGPAFYKSFHVNVAEDEVWISGGSHGEPWSHYGIYRFKNNEWKNYNRRTTDSLESVANISISITNPWNPQHIIAGSYGYGMVEFLNGEVVKHGICLIVFWNLFQGTVRVMYVSQVWLTIIVKIYGFHSGEQIIPLQSRKIMESGRFLI